MPDNPTRIQKPLYCIVTQPTSPSQLKPDMGLYSPKELAAKENTTTTSVYSWIAQGLPVMRRGDKGNILIHYQDYIQWMIDCAYKERSVRDIPSWAFRFVKSTKPEKKPVVVAQRPIPSKDRTETLSFLPMLDRMSK